MQRMLPSRPRAVITGAAAGLGRAFAERLAARGAELVLSDIDEAGLAETARLVGGVGAKATTVLCDIAKAPEVEHLHQAAQRALGGVDLLINNAGVAVGGGVGVVPLSDWEWIMGINLWGVIYGCHYFLPDMKARGSGHVLNVASIAGIASAGEMGPYNVTKAGVIALTETLAGELHGTGVGATVLCPYFFTTNIGKSARSHSARVGVDKIHKLMEKNPIQAPDVADIALRACERDKLYCFPHKEAKVIAALKRVGPETFFTKLAPQMAKLVSRG